MALTLDASVGGTGSNSYISQADATTFFEGQFNASEWTDASTGDKDKALVMATSRLEREEYLGTPTDVDQRLQWPRANAPDRVGSYYASDAIPRPVEEATCLLALAILQDNSLLADTGLEQYDTVNVGPLAVDVRHGRKAGTLPQEVIRALRGLRAASTWQPPIVRG